MTNRRPVGRSPVWTEERINGAKEQIVARIIGCQSLEVICKDDQLPGTTTVYRWLSEDASFRERYACAREAQSDFFAEQIVGIADQLAVPDVTADEIQAARVRIDARKWIAGKVRPKKWGDKQQLELSGDLAIKRLTDDEIHARLAALRAKRGL